ncbi:hypothetical protein GCM10010094_85680 [Streptomyces flaveus]|uniref:Uncharacterized protein n=1 Tax=Streptomyces flaveus TaxID=66370 RepID=A0A917VT58_9ACTN|nr:hypothetical protein GCM10010094_85680 [Streptomyces flaveus]
MADGERQHHHGGARDAQPHHVERVEARVDQGLGRDTGSPEGDRRHEREAQPDASSLVPLTALRRTHRHMMTGDDRSVTLNDTCLDGWTRTTADVSLETARGTALERS